MVVIFLALSLVQSQKILIKTSRENIFNVEVRSEAIVNAVNEIISTFFIKKTSVLNILSSATKISSDHLNDILSQILEESHSRISILIGTAHKKRTNDGRLNEVNIFFVDSYRAFSSISKSLDPDEYNYRGYYLVVLLKPISSQNFKRRVFENLWSKYIVNVNVIQPFDNFSDGCWIYTYYPYSPFYCEKVQTQILNTYINGVGFNREADHFPRKVSNLYNCSLSVATFKVPPFVMYGKKNDVVGVDGNLMRMIARQMNFHLKIKMLPSAHWGEVKNRSSTGAVGMVIDGTVNFTMGYFTSSSARNTFMSTSYTYHSSVAIWVISPGSDLTWFQRLHKPFSLQLWITIGVIALISFIVILIIGRQSRIVRNFVFGLNIKNPAMNMINIFFGGAMPRLPRRNFARFLLALLMIYSLVLRNVYNGSMFRYLQTDKKNPPSNTYEEMNANNYTFHVLDVMKEFMDNFPILAKRSQVLTYEMLNANRSLIVESGKKLAVLASEDHVAFWNKVLYPHYFFNTAEEKAATLNLVAYLHKTSCLTREFTRVMLELTAVGLIDAIEKQYIDKSYLKKKKIKREPEVITIKQLAGTFLFWTIGAIASVTVFISELIFGKIARRIEKKFFNLIALR